MILRLLLFCPLFILTSLLHGQDTKAPLCGQKELAQQLYRLHPEFKQKHDAIEKRLYQFRQLQRNSRYNSLLQGGGTMVLPVVVHIIHNNGPENISDNQVKQGIAYLNQAFAASGYYNNGSSTNTHIQFCMAERGPDGTATDGITRNVSRYTVMGGDTYSSDDQNVKNINRWNPYNYINIWVVNSIPGDVVGYSTLPEAHGTPYEGIIMEAGYFGSSLANNVVLIHEIGHYLGLYHTFEGGCTNNNCMTDGDMVCDTPPDQSTAYINCDATMNSCTTDTKSGFNTDQNDLTQDYMDYGNFNCMKVFTPGQSERMNWFIQNELFSLLNCKSCQPPCLSPVQAAFTASAKTVKVNTSVSFTNHSVNAAHFIWYIDGIQAFTTKDIIQAFAVQGTHVITLQASGDSPLCDSAVFSDTIVVTCPVKAGFTYPPGSITMHQTVSFTNTSLNATGFIWKVNSTTQGTSAGFSYTFPQAGIYRVTLFARGECTDTMSQQVSVYDSTGHIPQDICKPITFQKIYNTNSQNIWGMNITRDSGYIACGQYLVPGVDGYGSAYVLKLNKAGGVDWARAINRYSDEELDRIKENPDGSFIACGREWSVNDVPLTSKAILMKLDAKGNVLWAKKFGIANSLEEAAMNVTATNDGGYAFCGVTHDDQFKLSDWLVVKTDGNGNVQWSKTLDNGFYERAYSIVTTGDTLVVAGIRTLPTGPRSEIVLTKMLASNGTVLQSEVYDVNNRSVEFTSIYKIPGGYLVGAESVADGFFYADMDQLAMQVDENLQPVHAAIVAIDVFASSATGLYPTPDGGFVTARNSMGYSNPEYTDTSWVAIAKITPGWTLDWVKQYRLPFNEGHTVYTPKAVYPTPDGGYVTGETTFRKGDITEHFRVIKTSSTGSTPGCNVKDFQASLPTPPVRNEAFTWATVQDVVLNNPVNAALPVTINTHETISNEQLCSTSDCDSVKLHGSAKQCNLSDTVTYAVYRNPACQSSVLWQTDTSVAKTIAFTDTTISLQFKQAGKTRLDATIFTACKLLQDSLVITVSDSSTKLNLGPDIQLCTSSIVKLNAGKDFISYKWNTGSVDSTLTAYTPGKYYVTVTNNCGGVFSDTLLITLAPAVSLSLTADVSRCDQDSVTLTAKAGFGGYSWSPAYNTSTVASNKITVWPASDTTYTVVASINDHCTVTDSTRVHILHTTPVSIGNDTAFCLGGSVTLHVQPGFVSYTWPDGSTGPAYTASHKGAYWLWALNTNGCYSKDTMLVTDVYPLPPINLGNDGKLCLNSTVLHAGPGQAAYLWQNGSADSVYTVSATGTYWVTVTGNNSCTNSDTIIVTGFNTIPAGFLNQAASFCENGSVTLEATGQWVSYLWGNNISSNNITVNQAGQYWLQVTDANGCVGKDTIMVTVKTDCPKVIYFPNAFTPNGDGKNDFFKPFTGAPLEKYDIVIYNRWGQKIFESTDPLNGWDGRFKGTNINSGGYIYFCRYKFYGEADGVVKGTVLLLK